MESLKKDYDIEENLVEKLNSTNENEIHSALLCVLENYLQNLNQIKKLEKYSIVKRILSFTENAKFRALSVYIIAKGSLELRFVNEVIRYDGISYLKRIMKSCVNDEIKNKACYAIGNLAKFETGYKAVYMTNPISDLIKFLYETNDVNYQQTAVCTLMNLGEYSKTRELINKKYGLIYIAKLLKSNNVQVLICSIKAVAILTHNCNIIYARQLLQLHFHTVLIELNSHCEVSIRKNALISLKNLSSFEEIRTELIKVGAISLLAEILLSCKSYERVQTATLTLCKYIEHFYMCFHNGIDRSTALKALLTVLKNKQFQSIHISIIKALIPLSYDFNSSETLINLDVLQILIEILSDFIVNTKCISINTTSCIQNDKEIKEDDIDNFNESSYQIYRSNKKSANIEFSISPSQKNYSYCYKSMHKWDSPMDNCYSATNDFSKSPSPNRICSLMQKHDESSEFNFNVQVASSTTGSTSSGASSPVSFDEDNLSCINNWSPIISTQFCPSFQEDKVIEHEKNEDIVSNEFFLTESDNSSFLESYSIDKGKTIASKHEHFHDKSPDYLESMPPQKKFRTIPWNLSYDWDFSPDSENPNYSYQQHSVDYWAITFISQLYFHIDRKNNSPIADKTFFTTFIDYLCLTHDPVTKAETVLMNLIKNRYCLEKTIMNGFFCFLEEKVNLGNFDKCSNHFIWKLACGSLMDLSKQELESHFGIGTLSHVLITAGKKGRLNGICTASKFVTDKSSLHKILFDANGLSLLLDFLSDFDVETKMKAMIALCDLHQSLTKQQSEKCCFTGACKMKVSTKCFYKDSFYKDSLNVTFIVNDGVQIHANREKICENSDYFKALLQGHFLESNSGLVSLPHISAKNLSIIFHFLHGCGNENCCPDLTRIPFSVLLDLLSDCEKFLLITIKSFIQDRLCHHLSPALIPMIYEKSKIHNSPELAKKSLCSILQIPSLPILSYSTKKDLISTCFSELLNLNTSVYVHSDIISLFKDLLPY